MSRYVAFLRGINVGGNKKVPMADLKACLEEAGFANVKTLLNSGNVAFDSDKSVDEKMIGGVLRKKFGFEIGLTTRTQPELEKLVQSNPFKAVEAKSYYMTLLKTDAALKTDDAPTTNSKILKAQDKAVFWYVLPTAPNGATLDVMTYLDKTIGKDITTRNWSTIVKASSL